MKKYTSAKHLFNFLLEIVVFRSANVSFTIKTYQLVRCLNTFSTIRDGHDFDFKIKIMILKSKSWFDFDFKSSYI